MNFISDKEEVYIFKRFWGSDVDVYVESWDITPDGPSQRQESIQVYLRTFESLELDLKEVCNLLKAINKGEKNIKMGESQLKF